MTLIVLEAQSSYPDVFDIFIYILPYLAAVALTLATIYFDKISSYCCQCWTSAGEYVGVYDPEQPDKEFKLENGEVVEVTNEDKEESLGELSEVTSSKTTNQERVKDEKLYQDTGKQEDDEGII